jgi:hypothetical protein
MLAKRWGEGGLEEERSGSKQLADWVKLNLDEEHWPREQWAFG